MNGMETRPPAWEPVRGTEAVFVPADPPRDGRLALWGEGITATDGGSVELVLPTGSSVRRRTVPARLLTVAEAIDMLTTRPVEDLSRSLAVWSRAALAALGLVARGRVLPGGTEAGWGAWRVGPLDEADLDWLKRLAAAAPPVAHALAVPDTRPPRIPRLETLVERFWDAIADTFVRTAAASVAVSADPFTRTEPVAVAGPTDWLRAEVSARDAGVRVVLRLELPDTAEGETPTEADEPFRAVVQLRGRADPSLVVDAADLWNAPPLVRARLGESAETEMLLALRRGARAWSALAPALERAEPTAIELSDEAVDELLGPAAERLAAAGLDVLWPRDLLIDEVTTKATATPTPESVTEAGLTLDSLLQFSWQPTLGGQAMTEDEITALAEAKRPFLRMRGRWVRVDRKLLDRLRRRRSHDLTAVEALAAALTGVVEVDGERVAFTPPVEFAQLLDRLSASTAESVPVPAGLRAQLRPYQRRGLGWLALMADSGLGGCLADDMGLGKTIQVIALHLHRHSELSGGPPTHGRVNAAGGPTLVVCPTSLLGNWERELARFAPAVPVRRYHGGDRHLTDLGADEVVLVTYGVVRRDTATLADVSWGLVVADEAQHVKNPLSRTAKELRRIPAQARLALSGTPVENRLTDLWAILDWTTPGLLGTLEDFRKQVAVPVERYRDAEATDRLSRLSRPFLLRRRKSDPGIAPELPAKTETDRIVPLTAEQASLYQAVVTETMAEISAAEGIARRGLVLKLLTGLKQVCNHPAQYLHESTPLAGRSGKLAALDELLEVIGSEGESVLVFSQYVEMCRLLETHLTERGQRTLFLHGGISAKNRERMVADFQDGRAPIFLLSLKAGGVGLNLTRATHVIHFDRWWNPAVEDQATDRAYRIGQDRRVQVHRLITEGTLEDRIATLLESKRELADAIVGSGETWLTELADDELAALVTLGQAV